MDDVREKIGQLSAKAEAAHSRIDRVETEIKNELRELVKEMKELNAYMNRGKGWASAMLLLSGIVGAGIFKLLTMVFNKG